VETVEIVGTLMNDEEELLIAEVRLGVQTKEFLGSPVGKYIMGRAGKAREEAFTAWEQVDPSDVDSIRELQFRARLSSLVMTWLDEVINQAQHAEDSLHEIDRG
jgi:hypothetical protein|tara:strand:+ start:5682 stop:5993 length:312 start_codon:yes stop_codon:yes gene_type:complete